MRKYILKIRKWTSQSLRFYLRDKSIALKKYGTLKQCHVISVELREGRVKSFFGNNSAMLFSFFFSSLHFPAPTGSRLQCPCLRILQGFQGQSLIEENRVWEEGYFLKSAVGWGGLGVTRSIGTYNLLPKSTPNWECLEGIVVWGTLSSGLIKEPMT